MANDQPDPEAREEQLDRLLADYLRRMDAGQPVDRDEFLRQHPESATLLAELLDTADLVDRMAGPHVTADDRRVPADETSAAGNLQHQLDETIDADPPTKTFPSGKDLLGGEDGPDFQPCMFGDYELLEIIGRGGMGVVYKARQIKMDRIVAVKMILTGQLASENDVRRFYAEARAAGSIDHPNIVTIYEVDQREGHHYFSMDYVEGSDLAGLVQHQPLDPRRAARYLRDAALAIHAVHQLGILHRDLKPGNILIDKDDRVLITDFGLAKNLAQDGGITSTGAAMGTPSYMAPEQAAGQIDRLGPQTDVYSLGAILYVLLTGRPPFRCASIAETMMSVIHEIPLNPRSINPTADRQLDAICMKCLAKDPLDRYASASELADDLQRFLDHQPVRAKQLGPLRRLGRWLLEIPVVAALCGRRIVTPSPLHHRVQTALLGSLFLIAVGVLFTYSYLHWRHQLLPRELRIATGSTSGMYYQMGQELAARLHEDLERVVHVDASAGSVENSNRVRQGEAQLALLQQSMINSAEVSVVAPLYLEVVLVVVRKSSPIEQFSELSGQPVSLGPPQSGMRETANRVLRYGGINPETLSKSTLPFDALATDPQLQAAIVTTSPHNPALRQLLRTGDYRLLSLPHAASLPLEFHTFHFIQAAVQDYIPGDTSAQKSFNTVATPSILVVRHDAPDRLVEAALHCLYQEKPLPVQLIPRQNVALFWQDLPYHPRAREYFAELSK